MDAHAHRNFKAAVKQQQINVTAIPFTLLFDNSEFEIRRKKLNMKKKTKNEFPSSRSGLQCKSHEINNTL